MQLSSLLKKNLSPVSGVQLHSGLQELSSEEFAQVSGGDFPPLERIAPTIIKVLAFLEDC